MTVGVTTRPSILVVVDNPLIVNVVRSLLAAQDYQVFSCGNGVEALRLLEEKSVDVIVCDVMMPQMDGYQLHDEVRKRGNLAHIPFIFLTALGEGGEVSHGQESGADDYLVKPFEPHDLLSVVKGKILRSHYLRSVSEQRYENYRKKVIHTLSHEFRTPLVAINTGTELLIDQQAKLDEKKIASLLEAVRRGGQRLEKLVGDFMVLQQIEAGIAQRMYESHAALRSISDIVKEVVDAESAALEKEGFVVRYLDHTDGAAHVHVYEPHIQDIIMRVLTNAAKFSPTRKEIEVVIYPQEREVVVEVRDYGIGFDVTKVKEATDIFGQIDRDKLEQQGSGLGLAISNRYAVINKGHLDFEERDGGGSIVCIVLPIHART